MMTVSFSGAGESHHLKDALVNKRTQAEDIRSKLPGKGVVFLQEFSLEDAPYPLIVSERLIQYFIAVGCVPVILHFGQFLGRPGEDQRLDLAVRMK